MEGKEVENKQVTLKRFIDGNPMETDMEVKVGNKIKLNASKGSGAFLVKNLYLSCDPYMRGRMRDFRDSYIPPFVPGSPLQGFGVAKVVDSDNPNFKPGDLVSGITGWEEYSLIQNTEQLRKIEQDGIPLSYHIGLLGMPGFTAYAGFYEVCSPRKREYVLVSAASGAVGQLVGQLAKLHGCFVVGSAGTSQKVDLLKDKLGFDEAFNYKEEPDLDAVLKRYFPHLKFDITAEFTLIPPLAPTAQHYHLRRIRTPNFSSLCIYLPNQIVFGWNNKIRDLIPRIALPTSKVDFSHLDPSSHACRIISQEMNILCVLSFALLLVLV